MEKHQTRMTGPKHAQSQACMIGQLRLSPLATGLCKGRPFASRIPDATAQSNADGILQWCICAPELC